MPGGSFIDEATQCISGCPREVLHVLDHEEVACEEISVRELTPARFVRPGQLARGYRSPGGSPRMFRHRIESGRDEVRLSRARQTVQHQRDDPRSPAQNHQAYEFRNRPCRGAILGEHNEAGQMKC